MLEYRATQGTEWNSAKVNSMDMAKHVNFELMPCTEQGAYIHCN
jgi:hypothetical protein